MKGIFGIIKSPRKTPLKEKNEKEEKTTPKTPSTLMIDKSLTLESDSETTINSPRDNQEEKKEFKEETSIEMKDDEEDTKEKKRKYGTLLPTGEEAQLINKYSKNEEEETHKRRKVLITSKKDIDTEVLSSDLKEFSDNLKYSVNNKVFSDVLIRVGANLQVLYGHRVILANRCSYFNQLFSKNHSELIDRYSGKVKIDKPQFSPETFVKALDYMYTGSVKISQEDVLELLSISDDMGINSLKEMCSKFIQDSVDVENSCMLLEISREYNTQSLTEYCLKFIDKHVIRVLQTKGFSELSEINLIMIISRKELKLSHLEEIDLFHSLKKWAENRKKFKEGEKPEIIAKELRETLKNSIVYVRFPLMTSEQISGLVEPTNIVPQELLFEAYKHHLVPQKNNSSPRFVSRSGEKKQVIRKDLNITQRNNSPPPKTRSSLGGIFKKRELVEQDSIELNDEKEN
jgi:hypothetical protein